MPSNLKPSKAAAEKVQLLGVAFAGADLVFEIDDRGVMTFALGAAEQVAGKPCDALVGRSWTEIFAESEASLLTSALNAVAPGQRQGPMRLRMRMVPGRQLTRFADLSLFRLPQSPPRLSCSLALGASAAPLEGLARDAKGMVVRGDFERAARTLLDHPGPNALRLDLIELRGLGDAFSGMDSAAISVIEGKIAVALQASTPGGIGAVEVAEGKYAMLGSPSLSLDSLSKRLANIAGPGVKPSHSRLPLESANPAQALKAVRYALDQFIAADPAAVRAGFEATMDRTVRQAVRFKEALASDDFQLVYQPIVDLHRSELHHFEALARFSPEASPADSIQMAEELDLIVEFDIAVVKRVAQTLRDSTASIRIAANISAMSLLRPAVLAQFEHLAREARLKNGLLIELTETKTFPDLTQASQAIQSLRRLGFAICLDDFGAGAASLNYLRQFDVDFVKIDGRYVTGLNSRPRDGIVLKHVTALCAEMGVKTIAEMIETSEISDEVKRLGVDFGQGWHFGKPTASPVWNPPQNALPVRRRRGAVEQWG